jgi:hypothetical protein
MRRWRKRPDEDDDDTLTFEDLETVEKEDDKPKRRPYLPPRPIRTHYSFDEDIDDEEGACARFDELEPKIRAGKYRPKRGDPWNAHVLYDMLKSMGEI